MDLVFTNWTSYCVIEGLGDSPKTSHLNHPQPSALSHSLTVQHFVLTSIQAWLLIAHLSAWASLQSWHWCQVWPKLSGCYFSPINLWFQPRKKSKFLSHLGRVAYIPGESNSLYSHLLLPERSWTLMQLQDPSGSIICFIVTMGIIWCSEDIHEACLDL